MGLVQRPCIIRNPARQRVTTRCTADGAVCVGQIASMLFKTFAAEECIAKRRKIAPGRRHCIRKANGPMQSFGKGACLSQPAA